MMTGRTGSAATAAGRTIAAARTIATGTITAGRGGEGRGRLGQARHTGGIHHHLAAGSGSGALTAHGRLLAEREVDDAALAAVHGIEAEGDAGPLHFLGGGDG